MGMLTDKTGMDGRTDRLVDDMWTDGDCSEMTITGLTWLSLLSLAPVHHCIYLAGPISTVISLGLVLG